ncbi:SGNH/GDSL hydrolase family protein [Rhodococcus sp. AD45-ID]|uniref:SGNH/GDSL hydrolase family protein n=1 Tax=Rhodococcus globerulus TaxID=33008 RepID=A0ABU4C0K2_RHOGO|nr:MULTISPECIES: SGNH/GDSL hydrolase family protein [Rhodococcus]KJF20909.1 GDSL-like Lipase/Acylhydrolase [Rhodococcus sp. AD45]MDV6270035.1 SGNH/GDSL hydrolase family protein [Rhodococcus globerulus]PSR38470.1 SGNH/GDSL hydrolase family protein [Rhodococcus sp. AD45-ID]
MTAERRRVEALLKDSSTPIRWVFTGDSITQGLAHTNGQRSYVEHFAERIRGEMSLFNHIVINTGVSGNRSSDVRDGFAHRIEIFEPSVVLIMLGTNDALGGGGVDLERFREDLSDIIFRSRALGAVPILQTPPPIDVPNAPTRSALIDYVEMTRQVAASTRAIFIDHYEQWFADSPEGPPPSLLADAFHPNENGHYVLADAVLRELGIADMDSSVATQVMS